MRSSPPGAPTAPRPPTGTPTIPPPRQMLRRWWRWLLFPALLVLNYVLILYVTPGQPQRVELSYTFFKQQVEANTVAQITTRTDTIQVTFRQPVPYQPDLSVPAKTVADFSTVIPAFADPGL